MAEMEDNISKIKEKLDVVEVISATKGEE